MCWPHSAPASLLPPAIVLRGRKEFNPGVKAAKSEPTGMECHAWEGRRDARFCWRFLTGTSGLISCVVCVFEEQSLTGRISEADGVAVNVRWEEEEEKKNIKRPEQAVSEHTGSAALTDKCCF